MNSFILKEAAKMAVLATSTFDPNLENTDALTELIMTFYIDIETFASQILQFSKDEIETMDKTTVKKLISKYID